MGKVLWKTDLLHKKTITSIDVIDKLLFFENKINILKENIKNKYAIIFIGIILIIIAVSVFMIISKKVVGKVLWKTDFLHDMTITSKDVIDKLLFFENKIDKIWKKWQKK